ncbi:hypothetical protein [Bradyrhizobium iriomotense]|uniref:Uncharacterized protein n=1 Tax=Bradyrhizobium iriomotense TaxID=441950 RepID=A0ABQ6BHM3_9BRAD|nr:hypothetical protein [Bradyrhizobium iriomotense]GLR91712.1 hypothetical protein GCM10007857_84300 [Bradyrhizobium iriomotense]
MPIRQYFVWVGSVLLLLLFVADWLLPALPAHSHSAIAPSERANLRIRSDQKWPERVVFDTAHAPVTRAAESGPAPDLVHEDFAQATRRSPLDAFAAVEEAPAAAPTARNENASATPAKPRQSRTRMTSAVKTH